MKRKHTPPIGQIKCVYSLQLAGLPTRVDRQGGPKVIFKLGFVAQRFFNVGRYFQIGTFFRFSKNGF